MSGYLYAKFQKNPMCGYREMLNNDKNGIKWLVWTAIIFFLNPTGSLFRNHVRLPSCEISENPMCGYREMLKNCKKNGKKYRFLNGQCGQQ